MKRVVLLLCVLGLAVAWTAPRAEAATKVKYAVDWVIYGPFAPWFLARDKGFYRETGLEVDISRGYGSGDVTRVASGERDLAFLDPAAIVLARGKGTHLKVIANLYEKAPMLFVWLKKTPIQNLRDLEGRSLGLAPAGVERVLTPALFELNQVDIKKVQIMSLPPAQKVPMLVAGKVDVITYYYLGKPLFDKETAHLGGWASAFFADHGLDLYSNSIVGTDEYIRKNPSVARAFVKASLKGFQYARTHSDEAVDNLLKSYPTLNRQVTMAALQTVFEIIFTPAAEKNGVGHMTEEKMKRTRDIISRVYKLSPPPKLEDVYTNDFLK